MKQLHEITRETSPFKFAWNTESQSKKSNIILVLFMF